MTVPWAVRGIFQGDVLAAVQGEGLHTAVHDKLRAVAVNSQVVDLIQQYGKDFRIDIVSIRFVIISFNGVLCPKVISPLGKDKRGAGMLFAGIDCFLYKRYGIDAAVGL